MEIRKASSFIYVSEEEMKEGAAIAAQISGLLDGSIVLPPVPERGDNPRWIALRDAAAASPVLAELVDLHKAEDRDYQRESWKCLGDEFGGYDGEAPDWPCETVATIAHHLGVDLADNPDHH